MKKIILAILILSYASASYAQEFRFGLTATPVFNWWSVDGTEYENDGTRIGFQYGLLFDQSIGSVERYAFSSGLLINYSSGSVSADSNLVNLIAKVQYIEIPVTLRLRSNEVNYVTYYGQFGITPGFSIKARGSFEYDTSLASLSDEDVDILKANEQSVKYNPINVSLTLGVGMEYSITENTAIMAGLFFQNGFTNIINDEVDDNNMRLKQLGIRLGVLF